MTQYRPPAMRLTGYTNIGNGRPVKLLHYIEVLEDSLGIKADMEMLPMQDGDVKATTADTSALKRDFGYKPGITVEEGLRMFVAWYREYYGIKKTD